MFNLKIVSAFSFLKLVSASLRILSCVWTSIRRHTAHLTSTSSEKPPAQSHPGELLTAEADDSIWRSYLSEDNTNLLAMAPFDRTAKTTNILHSLEKSAVAARARRKLANRREERAKEMIQEKGQLHMYRTENQMERIWMGRLVLEQDRVGDIKT